MLREVSSVNSKKYFKLQFETVYGGQGSFAGISFDRYLPTTIVVVSVLVAFNFFRSENLYFCLHSARHFRLSHCNFYSKMSAYFRGSNPHQADFMQQGNSSSVSCILVPTLRLNLRSGRALLKLERANLERRAAFVA